MARFDARTLAVALATIVLSAYAAKAENYVINPIAPCYTCNTVPKPQIPDLFRQSPKFEAPDRRPAVQDRMRPSVPGVPSTHRQR